MKRLTVAEWEEYKEEPLYKRHFSEDQLNQLIKLANGLQNGTIDLRLHSDPEFFKGDGTQNDGWVIATISRREALEYLLNDAVTYTIKIPPRAPNRVPSKLQKQINTIRTSCKSITEAAKNKHMQSLLSQSAQLYAQKTGTSYNSLWDLGPFSGDAFKKTLEGVEFLTKWTDFANGVLKDEIEENKKANRRHRGKEHIQGMTEELCRIWLEVFGRKIGTSETSIDGKACGPFVKFVVYAFSCLSIKMTPGAARGKIRAAKKRLEKHENRRLTLDDILAEPLRTN